MQFETRNTSAADFRIFFFFFSVEFLALIRSSFKFNGRLVVSSSFETNVEHVYAAGPVAEFVQNDSLLSLKHVFYNSVEIGARVADMLMQRVGIRVDNYRIKAKYVRPLSIYCKLPGNYNYLHSTVPDVKIQKCSAKTLRTESAAGRYFEMIVDNRDVVLQLSCYSKRVCGFIFNNSDIKSGTVIVIVYKSYKSYIGFQVFELDKSMREKRKFVQRHDGPAEYGIHSVFVRLFRRILGLSAVFGPILEVVGLLAEQIDEEK